MRALNLISVFFLTTAAFAAPGIGDTAPDFTLKGTDGKDYGLKRSLETHDAAVVIFVATKCPYSNAYNTCYNEMHDSLKKRNGKKVALLPINSNVTEPFDQVRAHAGENKYTFAVLKDEGYKVADAYAAEKTPEAFLVSKQGKVLYHGRIDDDSEGKNIKNRDLANAVDQYLSGKEVSVKETRSFGCSIKRK